MKALEWNGERMEITNLPIANQWIDKSYREGWRFTL